MGILSDFFAAAPEQIRADQFGTGPAGTFPTVQSTSVTPVELGDLLQVLPSSTIADAAFRRAEFPLRLTCPGGESWVIACPAEMRDVLAGASEEDLMRYAAGWAAFEQSRLNHADEAPLLSLLSGLAELCRLAQARGDSLLLWISV